MNRTSKMHARGLRVVALCLTAFLFVLLSQAQQSASLTGTVTDQTGAVVVGAKLSIQTSAGHLVKETISDSQGTYRFNDIRPGIYQLKVEALGFSPLAEQVLISSARNTPENLQLQPASADEQITVLGTASDPMTPDPSQRTFVRDELLEANPGRPGAPVSIPGLPIETASGGIKAPQYFAPGVAGDHGEPIAQFFQIGDFLFPNNLPANAHGNGYADPNVLISNGINSVESDGGAFNVREGNHSVDLAVAYAEKGRLVPFLQLTGDPHDFDLVTAWGPADPQTLGWIAFEASLGNGLLARPEHRQQYKLNAYRLLKKDSHQITLFGIGYYGSSYVPGLIPTDQSIPGDTIDPNQHDTTHNSLLVATDTWHAGEHHQLDFSGFLRTYGLDLRSDFGDGLIRQSEFRTVAGGNTTYLWSLKPEFSLLAGLDLRRDAPRKLNLDRLDAAGTFQPVTSNNLTLGFVAPFVALDGKLGRYFHFNLGLRREEVVLDNLDKLSPANSFNKLAGISLPKGTLTFLPPQQRYFPIVAFSFGEAFHTNDPRIGAPGQAASSAATVIVPSHAMQLVVSKQFAATEFTATFARVSNAMELAKIDPDTGLQEDVGPSLTRSVTLRASRHFSFASIQASWARANAIDRNTGQDIPEAPRLIWDVAGTLNRLPFRLRARGEYEDVGRKPLGDGFAAVPVREFRFSLVRSFRRGQMDVGLNSMLASGYTGQTLETLLGPRQLMPTEQIVGVPLKTFVSASCVYNFRIEPSKKP